MNIGMILKGKFPPDIRVEKEVRTLSSEGHNLFLLCCMNEDQPREEFIEGLRIHRINKPWENMNLFGHKWNALIFHLTFRNHYWAKEITKFIKMYNLDVLHVHDLPLLGTAFSVGKKFKIPVIADLHENYPAALGILNKTGMNFWNRFCTNPKRWSLYERMTLASVDKIIVVVQEARNRLLEEHNIDERKITILMNVVDRKNFSRIELMPDILNRYKKNFVVLYVGGGGIHRGLDSVIYSFRYLHDQAPDIKLLLIGPTGMEFNRIAKIISEEKLHRKVELIDWQEFEKIPSYIKASDVCLVPHLRNRHTDTTIPHKLFQYMFMKKPVLVSDCKPIKRIVEETASGLIFKSGKPKDLARKIINLYRNKDLRLLYGQKGYDAVMNHYNWEKESKKLISLYKSLT